MDTGIRKARRWPIPPSIHTRHIIRAFLSPPRLTSAVHIERPLVQINHLELLDESRDEVRTRLHLIRRECLTRGVIAALVLGRRVDERECGGDLRVGEVDLETRVVLVVVPLAHVVDVDVAGGGDNPVQEAVAHDLGVLPVLRVRQRRAVGELLVDVRHLVLVDQTQVVRLVACTHTRRRATAREPLPSASKLDMH